MSRTDARDSSILHRCGTCGAMIYTPRCVLCDGYQPTIRENSRGQYLTVMFAGQSDTGGIREIITNLSGPLGGRRHLMLS